jgi:hypothetical protein
MPKRPHNFFLSRLSTSNFQKVNVTMTTEPNKGMTTMTTTATAAADLEAAITRVRLESSLFAKAIEEYIDENKPDPLIRKQMQAWKFEWHNCNDDNNGHEKGSKPASLPTASWPEPPTHVLSGRLQWKGEYMSILIDVRVCWTGEKEGSLFFSCTIPADGVEFLPLPASTATATVTSANTIKEAQSKPKAQESKKDARAANRVHQGMIERLQKDDYIQLITSSTTDSSNSSSSNDKTSKHRRQNQQKEDKKRHHHDLCEATIHFSKSPENHHLEERVHCNDQTAEALRRAVFSTADSSLDIFDLILCLPLLPTTTKVHAADAADADAGDALSSTSCTGTTTTGLADRAKLRLLEDAMYDACEREEEEELVQDLHISKRAKRDE